MPAGRRPQKGLRAARSSRNARDRKERTAPARGDWHIPVPVGKLLAELVNLQADAFDRRMEEVLQAVAEFVGMTQGCLLQAEGQNPGRLPCTHSWCESRGNRAERPLSSLDLPWISERLLEQGGFWLPDAAQLPEAASKDRQSFSRSGIRSYVSVLLRSDRQTIGVLRFASPRVRQPWSDEIVQPIGVVAEILSSAIESRKVHGMLEEQIMFETLVSDTSRRFVHVPTSRVDDEIEQTLRDFVESLDADRGTLYQFDVPKKELYATHLWARTGTVRKVPEGARIGAAQFPLFHKILERGEVVCNRTLEDLPEEASTDKESLRFYEVKSNIGVPLMIGGRLLGALTLDALQEERDWPEPFVKRLKVLGEILANALDRKVSEEKLRRSFAEIKRLKNRLQAENVYFREEIKLQGSFDEIVGQSSAIKYVQFKIEQIAPNDTTALILGETGTGKELVARAIHDKSRRGDRNLIKVNCATIPPTLIEGELFGYEKGAFTGAHQRKEGRFEIAHGSTFFLDEIGELPLELQAKLLRVLQDGEFERLGSHRTVKVDVRIIAASNRDLEREAHEGRFRKDLWYRLNVFPITVPPLRDRKEDIPLLVNRFLEKSCKKLGKEVTRIPQGVLDELQAHSWPGNIRELENTIERAVINTPDHTLRLVDWHALPGQKESSPQPNETLAHVERDHILRVLEQTGWRVRGPKGAALILGLNPSTLRFRMKKLGIRRPSST